MLTEHKIFEGKLVEASLEPACREVPSSITPGTTFAEATRFNLVVDELDEPIAAVTEKYTLIRNREVIAALDLVADLEGVRLVPKSADYHHGKSRYEFTLPDLSYTVTGDTSASMPRLVLGNDYRGNGGLSAMSGWFRFICSNGMTIGTVASQTNARHVGTIDIMEILTNAIVAMKSRVEVDRLLAESLAAEPFPSPLVDDWAGTREIAQNILQDAKDDGKAPRLIDTIIADTPDRYIRGMRDSHFNLRYQLGDNLWALAQTVAEVATHNMNGRWSPDEWATRQIARIEAAVV
jgi:hypothetical protein